jgi:Antitoxin-like ribbon-helix-helix
VAEGQNEKRGEVVAAYLRPEMASKLRAIAAREDRSVSQIVRFALEAGLRDRP